MMPAVAYNGCSRKYQQGNIKIGLLFCALLGLVSRGFLVGACLHDQHAVLLLGLVYTSCTLGYAVRNGNSLM